MHPFTSHKTPLQLRKQASKQPPYTTPTTTPPPPPSPSASHHLIHRKIKDATPHAGITTNPPPRAPTTRSSARHAIASSAAALVGSVRQPLRRSTAIPAARERISAVWRVRRRSWSGFLHRPNVRTDGIQCCPRGDVGRHRSSGEECTCSAAAGGGRIVEAGGEVCVRARVCVCVCVGGWRADGGHVVAVVVLRIRYPATSPR